MESPPQFNARATAPDADGMVIALERWFNLQTKSKGTIVKRYLRGLAALATSSILTLGSVALAQPVPEYPTKTIRIVVPFPAGGATDILTRAVAERLSQRLGQPVVVENKPGGGANIGALAVVKAPPDGYTLLMGSIGSHSIAVTYYPNIGYDIRRDLAPISTTGTLGNALFLNADVPAQDLAGLVRLAKENPGKFTCGSSGTGGLIHLTCEMFKSRAGVDVLHIPYKGTSMLIPDLVSGRVTMALDTIPPYLPLLKDGKLKVLAVTMSKRSPLLPDVPTIAESGYPDFDSIASYGLFAPAGTPPAIIERLNREVNAAIDDPALQKRMLEQGIELKASTAAQLQAFVEQEVAKWAEVIRVANIQPER